MKNIAAVFCLAATQLLLCACMQFTVDIPAYKDAYVNTSSPNTNYGSRDYMVLWYINKQFSVIGFDISEYLNPMECHDLVRAELVLPPLLEEVRDEAGNELVDLHLSCRVRAAQISNTGWDEHTVTKANLDFTILANKFLNADTNGIDKWDVTIIVMKAILQGNPEIDFLLISDPCAIPSREAGYPSILRLTFSDDTCDTCVSQMANCDFFFEGTNYNAVPTFDLKPCPGTGVGDCALTTRILHNSGTPLANANSQNWELLLPGPPMLGSQFSKAHQFYTNANTQAKVWTQEFNDGTTREDHEGLCVKVPLQSYRINQRNCNYPGTTPGCAAMERACVVFRTS